MRKIGIYPSKVDRGRNEYFNLIEKCMTDIGCEVVEFRDVFLKREVKYAYLNFYENINQKNIISAWMKYFQKIMALGLVKVLGKKIIITVHNKRPHDTKYADISTRLMRHMINMADAIIELSSYTDNVIHEIAPNAAVTDKIYLIPHPIFDRVIPDFYNNKKDENGNSKMKVLFVGQIRRYKNIELIIQLAKEKKNDNSFFYIFGMCNDSEYYEKLRVLSDGLNNIQIQTGFLDEKTLQRKVSECDVMILPYDKRSSLNSGTLHLAFSLGKTCICPDIGSALDFPDDIFYIYHYDNEEDHYLSLRNAYEKAYDDYCHGTIENMGAKCFSYMLRNNSRQSISQRYDKLFYDLER